MQHSARNVGTLNKKFNRRVESTDVKASPIFDSYFCRNRNEQSPCLEVSIVERSKLRLELCYRAPFITSRDRLEVVPAQSHKLIYAGSTPAPATIF